MKKLALSSLLFCLLAQSVHAEYNPRSTRFDNRVKNVEYNPDNVTRVNVSTGIATLIQFGANESINGVALGDPMAWKVNTQANNVWIRPADIEPDTNLTVVTDKRTYLFNLVSVKHKNSASWSVRFNYPDNNKNTVSPWIRPCQGAIQNYRYFANGDKSIYPLEMWDNGTFTCLKIQAGADLPVVFKKLPDGREGLVNSHVENGFIVIHEVNSEYRLRLGDLVAGLKTDKLKSIGTNMNGTTNGKVREIIND